MKLGNVIDGGLSRVHGCDAGKCATAWVFLVLTGTGRFDDVMGGLWVRNARRPVIYLKYFRYFLFVCYNYNRE